METAIIMLFAAKYLKHRLKYPILSYAVVIPVALAVQQFNQYLQIANPWGAYIFLAVEIGLFALLFKGRIGLQLLIVLLYNVFGAIMDSVSVFVITQFDKSFYEDIISRTATQVIATIIAKAALAGVLFLITRINNKVYGALSNSQLVMIDMLMFFAYSAIMTAFSFNGGINNMVMGQETLVALAAMLVVAFLLILYWKNSEKLQITQLAKEAEENIVKQLTIENEVFAARDEKVKELLHEIDHVQSTHQQIIKESSSEAAEELLEALDNKAQSIFYQGMVKRTGNIIIDSAMLGRYKAKFDGVLLIIEGSLPDKLPFNSDVLNCIITNALDNAAEACHRISDNTIEKAVTASFIYKNQALSISIGNPYEGQFSKISKKESSWHGHGIKLMQECVRKYNGELSYWTKDSYCTLEILLYTHSEPDVP